jgi:hypothetical protein
VLIKVIYGSTYTAALWSKAQFTTKLFHNASKSLAELIYSAWVEAGSPVFGTKTFVNGIEQTSAVNILVYPNPTTGVINVSSDEDLKIEVCSITGTSLGNYTGKQIDLSKLSNGMYILSMVGKDGLNKKEKILISK